MPITNDIDTGVAALPAARPSVFSPPQNPATVAVNQYANGPTLNRPFDTGDTGTATNPAPTFNNFDPQPYIPDVASPGV